MLHKHDWKIAEKVNGKVIIPDYFNPGQTVEFESVYIHAKVRVACTRCKKTYMWTGFRNYMGIDPPFLSPVENAPAWGWGKVYQ